MNHHYDIHNNELTIRCKGTKAIMAVKPNNSHFIVHEYVWTNQQLDDLILSLTDARDSL